MQKHGRRSLAAPTLLATLLLAGFLGASSAVAGELELIPSVGITKSTDENAGNAQGYAGLALRAPLAPWLKVEGGIAYRQDSYGSDALGDDFLHVRQWPITASLWAFPTPMFYAGAGLGWYRTTYDYDSALQIRDETDSKVGFHIGGGISHPLSPKLGLDVNGRYIFMQQSDDASLEVPTTFDPDFWSLTAGLAFKF